MYRYMRANLKDEYGILELQDKILEAMEYLDGFMKDHNIKYFIYAGSTLGAVRHHGFIPWDDDFDIALDFENYNKFIDVCKKDLDKNKYYLQIGNTDEYPNYYSKLRINNTTYIEEANKSDMHQGIFIDIFCLDNVPNNKVQRKIQYFSAILLKSEALSKFNYKTNDIKKKMAINISKIIVKGKIKEKLYSNVKKYNMADSSYYTDILSGTTKRCLYWPKEYFKEQKYVDFEKIKLPIPCESEKLLEIQYGKDYMTPKIFISHSTKWDTNNDYRCFIENNDKGGDVNAK